MATIRFTANFVLLGEERLKQEARKIVYRLRDKDPDAFFELSQMEEVTDLYFIVNDVFRQMGIPEQEIKTWRGHPQYNIQPYLRHYIYNR